MVPMRGRGAGAPRGKWRTCPVGPSWGHCLAHAHCPHPCIFRDWGTLLHKLASHALGRLRCNAFGL